MKETTGNFVLALAFMLFGLALVWMLLGGTAHAQTVTKNGGQVSTVSGRWAELADGGCALQADCAFVNPDVRCLSSPQDARPAICAMMKQSFTRAATLSNGVGDGGSP